jgi:arylformamidase
MAEMNKYEKQYNARISAPDFQEHFDRWSNESVKTRAALGGYIDVPYGPHPMQKMDIFRARGTSRGTFMFIHGGYWRSMDKGFQSFVANELTKVGITVALPNYELCPKIKLDGIVMQLVQASAWLWRNASNFGAPAGKLVVSGHSAGGHLTAMMAACRFDAYAKDLPRDMIQGYLTLSGLYDIAPIAHVPTVNDDVKITKKLADTCSPALMPPATKAPIYTAVGSIEPEGFHVQNTLLRKKWKSVVADDLPCPGDHHFNILYRLTQPDDAMFKAVQKLVG